MAWIIIKRDSEKATNIIGIEDFYTVLEDAKNAVEKLNREQDSNQWDYLWIETH